jgi:monolysocardiolipin acyltransferase
MESKIPPVVIPMWITGFDQLMPGGRPSPEKYFPRVPARLSVTFGRPVGTDELRQALTVVERGTHLDQTATADRPEKLVGWPGERRHAACVEFYDEKVYNSLIRQQVTAVIQRDVEALGRLVSGDSLRGRP